MSILRVAVPSIMFGVTLGSNFNVSGRPDRSAAINVLANSSNTSGRRCVVHCCDVVTFWPLCVVSTSGSSIFAPCKVALVVVIKSPNANGFIKSIVTELRSGCCSNHGHNFSGMHMFQVWLKCHGFWPSPVAAKRCVGTLLWMEKVSCCGCKEVI
jgi:hypothetical protein